MSVNENSKAAYLELLETKKLPKRRLEVATALLVALKPMTSAMLEKWCSEKPQYKHLHRCTITGRFNELEKAEVIKVHESKLCEVTGSMAKYYTVVECL